MRLKVVTEALFFEPLTSRCSRILAGKTWNGLIKMQESLMTVES